MSSTVDLAKLGLLSGGMGEPPAMTQQQIEQAFAQRQAENRRRLGLPDGGWSGQNPALPPQMPQMPNMQDLQGAAFNVQPPQHPLLRTQQDQQTVDLQQLIMQMRGR